MAIIKCPNCKNAISNKAISCPTCGIILTKNNVSSTNICKECGSELRNDYSYCINCGCPIQLKNNEYQIRVADKTLPHKTRNKIIAAVISIVLLIAIFGSCLLIKNSAIANYKETLNNISALMLEGAAEAEETCNLVYTVWYNSIYHKYDSKTDKYTLKSSQNKFNDDFNDSLSNLFNDTSFCEMSESITTNQNSVTAMMKELMNPPNKYQEAYAALNEYYNAYLELTDLALFLNGRSLNEFESDFKNAEAELMKTYNTIKLYL